MTLSNNRREQGEVKRNRPPEADEHNHRILCKRIR